MKATRRMPFEFRVKKLLGLPGKLPKDFQELDLFANIAEGFESPRVLHFCVLNAHDADLTSRADNGDRQPGRGRPRVFAQCDFAGCNAWISAGRFNQHYHLKHEVGR